MKPDLLYGLATGILFGILLQRTEVIRYDRQLGALRLKDLTIVKFMLSTVVVAMVGTYVLRDMGLVKLSIKPMILGAVIPGGILFGLGWALLGYCPGTSAGAVGEGRLDALWGILGMLFGAGIYAEAYPKLQETLLKWGDYGKITLPEVLGVNHWIVIVAFVIATLAFFGWMEKESL
ncbi:MAG: YeeE/YedE family protein [Synergistaceae bacterium]|nr:YeeE/YedE family protein [Synergistaceae bacterium]